MPDGMHRRANAARRLPPAAEVREQPLAAQYEAELDFAVETAWIAGQLTLEFFRPGVETELKSDMTPVTAADRGAEELIRSRIAETFPNDIVVGEEFGTSSVDPSEQARQPDEAADSESAGRTPLVRGPDRRNPLPSSAACRSTAS